MSTPLRLVPITLDEANAFVRGHHRHNGAVRVHRFAVAVASAGEIVGVSIAGNPRARHLQDGWTVELLRTATDGTRNACSMLEGAICRAAFALGFRRVVTYTRKSEPGASLRAAGFRIVGEVKGREWDAPSRPRVRRGDLEDKWRWERIA